MCMTWFWDFLAYTFKRCRLTIAIEIHSFLSNATTLFCLYRYIRLLSGVLEWQENQQDFSNNNEDCMDNNVYSIVKENITRRDKTQLFRWH